MIVCEDSLAGYLMRSEKNQVQGSRSGPRPNGVVSRAFKIAASSLGLWRVVPPVAKSSDIQFTGVRHSLWSHGRYSHCRVCCPGRFRLYHKQTAIEASWFLLVLRDSRCDKNIVASHDRLQPGPVSDQTCSLGTMNANEIK